jgi:aminotransferase
MDQSRFIVRHVVNLPKSGIRDFFDIVTKMKDASLPGITAPKPVAAGHYLH